MEAILSSISSFRQRYAGLQPLLRGGLFIVLLGGIYYQIVHHNNITTIFNEFLRSIRERPASYLCLAVGLMPFNLAFETLKWLHFTRFFCKMSFPQAYRAVLAGMSFAIVTPNRVGEYGGRLLLLAPPHRWQGAVSILLGSYCQWIVLIFGGLIGFSWFALNHLQWQLYIILILMTIGILICLILLLLFLQIGWFLPFIGKCGFKKRGRRWLRQWVVLRAVSLRAKWLALQWAGLRYLTYSLQYWLLLQFFGINVTLWEGVAGIWSIFLIQTGVPLSASLALLARGEIAIFVWSHFNANELSVLAATFGLFIINLVLPALLGAILLIKRSDSK